MKEFPAKQLTYHLTLSRATNPPGEIEEDNGEIPRNRLMLLTLVRFVATALSGPFPQSTIKLGCGRHHTETTMASAAPRQNAKQRRA